MLCLLAMLHVFWLNLFINIIYNKIFKKIDYNEASGEFKEVKNK
jgi:hypothetical protein